jgi:S1-C subfamily serine protease
MAVAIGSPVGLAAEPSVTVGVVSAVGQDVSVGQGNQLIDMIQTDARVAPGASGGALVDSSAAVIGITTAVAASGAQLSAGYAIPIETASAIASQLIATGHVTHSWLGVTGKDVDMDSAAQLKINGGGMVTAVESGSPAAKAGLTSGDVITHVDGRLVTSMDAIVVVLRVHKPGDTVDLVFLRDGKQGHVRVVVRARPSGSGS